MKIRISFWSEGSNTWIHDRDEEVLSLEQTSSYYYVRRADGREYEYPKNSLFDTSYKIEIIEK